MCHWLAGWLAISQVLTQIKWAHTTGMCVILGKTQKMQMHNLIVCSENGDSWLLDKTRLKLHDDVQPHTVQKTVRRSLRPYRCLKSSTFNITISFILPLTFATPVSSCAMLVHKHCAKEKAKQYNTSRYVELLQGFH